MKRRSVELTSEAEQDLADIGDYVAQSSDLSRAREYVGRIEAFCDGLGWASERGERRDHIRPGLRAIGFERSATIVRRYE